MKTLLFTILILFFSLPVLAERNQEYLRYNSLEDKWEYATSEDHLKYNPFERKWSYERSNSHLKYNPLESKWEYAE